MEKYTLQELRTPGTVLPINARQVKVNLSDRSKDAYCSPWTLLKIPRKSFGSTTRNTEECILVEGLTYDGNWFYEVPVSEFRRLGLLDEFVLPEKWCINRQGLSEVYKWFNENTTTGVDYKDRKFGWYSHFPAYGGNCHTDTNIHPGYTEITFEQFKEYVLGIKENMIDFKEGSLKFSGEITEDLYNKIIVSLERQGYKPYIHCGMEVSYKKFSDISSYLIYHLNVDTTNCYNKGKIYTIDNNPQILKEVTLKDILKENNMKKIIGYKSKDQQSFNNAKKLADPGTYFGTGCTFSNGDTFTPGSGHADFFQKAGVLDIWFTPIYEEDRIKKLGKYDVSMDGAFVKVGCTTYSKDALWGAKQVLEAPNVQAIKCDGLDLTLADVNNLLKYFE